MLSNFLTYDIKRQYLENPNKFEGSGKGIYEGDEVNAATQKDEEEFASAAVAGNFGKNPFA